MVDLVILDESHKVIYNPAILAVGPYRKLMKKVYKESDRNKKINMAILTYIFFRCDYRSGYLQYDKEKREKLIKEGAGLPDDFQPDEIVEACMDFYKEMQMTETMNFLITAREAMSNGESTLQLLQDITKRKLDELATMPKDKVKLEDIQDLIKGNRTLYEIIDDIPKRYETIKNLEEKVRSESREQAKKRGGKAILKFEKTSSLTGIVEEKSSLSRPDLKSHKQTKKETGRSKQKDLEESRGKEEVQEHKVNFIEDL